MHYCVNLELLHSRAYRRRFNLVKRGIFKYKIIIKFPRSSLLRHVTCWIYGRRGLAIKYLDFYTQSWQQSARGKSFIPQTRSRTNFFLFSSMESSIKENCAPSLFNMAFGSSSNEKVESIKKVARETFAQVAIGIIFHERALDKACKYRG